MTSHFAYRLRQAAVFAAPLCTFSLPGTSNATDSPSSGIVATGAVTDAEGTPTPAADVAAIYRTADFQSELVTAQTDGEGNYCVELPSRPRDEVNLVAWKPGHAVGFEEKRIGDGRIGPARTTGGIKLEAPIQLGRPKPISLRIRNAEGEPVDAAEEDASRRAMLALAIARYDRMPELLPQIVEPIFAFWQQRIGDEQVRFTDRRESIMALALADPQRAAEWAIAFDEQLSDSRRRHIPQPWEVVLETLTGDRDEAGKAITRSVYHHWVIDEYD